MVTVEESASSPLASKRITSIGVLDEPQGQGGTATYRRLRDRNHQIFRGGPLRMKSAPLFVPDQGGEGDGSTGRVRWSWFRRESGRLTGMAWLLVFSWLSFVAAVLWRPHRGEYNAWLDVGLYNVPFGVAALACLLRASRDHVRRTAWRLLGFGLLLFIVGNFYGSLVVGDADIYPSPADGMWLSFYVLVYVAIVIFVRSRVTGFHPNEWLDGGVGGFGAAALVVAFALGPVLADTEGKLSVVVTNLSYPTVEILLIIFLVTAGTAMRNRSWSWWLLTAGLVVFCAADVTYLFQQSSGTYKEGGLLDVSWPLATAMIGLAACSRNDRTTEPAESRLAFLVPSAFTTSSILLLVYGQGGGLPPVAAGLAVVAIGLAAVRTVLTVREVRSLAESRREARTDDLTGLGNRRAFSEQLEAALADEDSIAVMMFDLDSFKEINDSLGHDLGDELLRQVATRFSRVFKVGAISRLGGDEFGAFVTVAQPDRSLAIAQRALATLDEPFELGDMNVRVGASVGIALSPLHSRRRSELMRCADIAMYHAKRSHGNITVYEARFDPNTVDRLRIIDELRGAIADRQLELHYQPTVELASGRIRGVEALVRWRRVDGTLWQPDSFISIAEDAGLINQLTRAVLEQAIAFIALLNKDHPEVRLSVNISGIDLLDENLVPYIRALLDANDVTPDQLTLEITETALVADLELARRSTVALRGLGVRISVDDFGVGYSSMAELIGFTIDELKIDKTFVTELDTDYRLEAIVRATLELGRALNLTVVAEGVETAAALEILERLGCSTAQGYHIARPLTPEQLTAFLSAHTLRATAAIRPALAYVTA
jgi:diguanylate cyclase